MDAVLFQWSACRRCLDNSVHPTPLIAFLQQWCVQKLRDSFFLPILAHSWQDHAVGECSYFLWFAWGFCVPHTFNSIASLRWGAEKRAEDQSGHAPQGAENDTKAISSLKVPGACGGFRGVSVQLRPTSIATIKILRLVGYVDKGTPSDT